MMSQHDNSNFVATLPPIMAKGYQTSQLDSTGHDGTQLPLCQDLVNPANWR